MEGGMGYMKGWISIDRSITEHWVWQDAKVCQRWLDLLIVAQWENREVVYKGERVQLRRGDIICTFRWLAGRWQTNAATVSKILELLESDGMIKVIKRTKYTIVRVMNYDQYQQSGEPTEAETAETTVVENGKSVVKNGNITTVDQKQKSEVAAAQPEKKSAIATVENSAKKEAISNASGNAKGNTLGNTFGNTLGNTNKQDNNINNLNNNIHTHTAHAREEEAKAKERQWGEAVKGDFDYQESLSLAMGVDIFDIPEWVERFRLEMIAKKNYHKDEKDYRAHFWDWIRQNNKKLKYRNDNGTENKQGSGGLRYAERRGTEVEAKSPAEYYTTF